MAKVEINESVVEVEHESSIDSGKEGKTEKEDEKKKPDPVRIDVDTLVNICVERVFDMLKANYDR